VGTEPTHFDFMRAKEQKSGDWLVLHLGELVALAYQVATGILESVRPKGVELLDVILDKVNPDDFGDCSESLCRVENECMNESYA
jgi:hypothetical protein